MPKSRLRTESFENVSLAGRKVLSIVDEKMQTNEFDRKVQQNDERIRTETLSQQRCRVVTNDRVEQPNAVAFLHFLPVEIVERDEGRRRGIGLVQRRQRGFGRRRSDGDRRRRRADHRRRRRRSSADVRSVESTGFNDASLVRRSAVSFSVLSTFGTSERDRPFAT